MSGRSPGDEFTEMERRLAFENNSELLKKQFPDTHVFQSLAHYICESCGFVSNSRSDFNIDHVVPVAEGGTRNRVSKQVNAQLRDAQRLDAGEDEIEAAIALLFKVGNNAGVLCTECNNRKGALLYVPAGSGLAYTRHADDLNPVHMVSGPPKPGPRW